MLPWLTLTALAGDSAPAQSALLSGAVDAPAALSVLQAQGPEVSSAEDVQYALEHGWWEPAKHMLRTMRERGDAVTTMQSVRTTATRIRDEATEVINLLRVSTLLRYSAALPPRCHRAATTLPPRCHRAATALPPRCHRAATAPPAPPAMPVRHLCAATALPRLHHCSADTLPPPRCRRRSATALRCAATSAARRRSSQAP